MSILEKLAGAKALIESAIEEELERTAPPPEAPSGECQHTNTEDITAAGTGKKRVACVDCGQSWEVD